MPFVTIVRAPGGATVARREFNRAIRSAYERLGEKWHDDIAPKHFTLEGARLYQYQKRESSYMKRKARVKGHQLPLVWSGEARTAVLMARRIRATRKGVKVTMFAPKYFYQYRKDLTQPDKAYELTKTSPAEAESFATLLDMLVTDRVNERTG